MPVSLQHDPSLGVGAVCTLPLLVLHACNDNASSTYAIPSDHTLAFCFAIIEDNKTEIAEVVP